MSRGNSAPASRSGLAKRSRKLLQAAGTVGRAAAEPARSPLSASPLLPPPASTPPTPPPAAKEDPPKTSAIASSGPQKLDPRPRDAARTAAALRGTEDSLTPQSKTSKRELPSSTQTPEASPCGPPSPLPPDDAFPSPSPPSTPNRNCSHEVAVTGCAEGSVNATEELQGHPWRKEPIGTGAEVDQAQPSALAAPSPSPPLPPAPPPATTLVTTNHRPTPSSPPTPCSAAVARPPSRAHSRTHSLTWRASGCHGPVPPAQESAKPGAASCVSGVIDKLCAKYPDDDGAPPPPTPVGIVAAAAAVAAASGGSKTVALRRMRISRSRAADSAESAAHCLPRLESCSNWHRTWRSTPAPPATLNPPFPASKLQPSSSSADRGAMKPTSRPRADSDNTRVRGTAGAVLEAVERPFGVAAAGLWPPPAWVSVGATATPSVSQGSGRRTGRRGSTGAAARFFDRGVLKRSKDPGPGPARGRRFSSSPSPSPAAAGTAVAKSAPA